MEHTAYAPLLQACAERGFLCVPVRILCNLAVLNVNDADGIKEQFPAIGRWYIVGHSLGGAMAASYAANHSEAVTKIKNDGLMDRYLYSDSHEAIISDKMLKVAQQEKMCVATCPDRTIATQEFF
ncbi:MAG: alpha/beta hydrolase [Ruminococcus flavefaciens]|nr:alpha/beta hydrolase [Ruminococcus flavefaciens]